MSSLRHLGAGPLGMLERGTVDLGKRPVVRNPDGSVSTLRSMSFNDGRREVLVPTLDPQGRQLTNEQAIELYRRTGQHLGAFDTPENADAYARLLSDVSGHAYSPLSDIGK